jgi:hypothetical protein
MSELSPAMSHRDAIGHLRRAIVPTATYETGRLVDCDSPAFFGATRGVMCDLDYVSALYCGWDGKDERQIATRAKTIRFLIDVVAFAASNSAYGRYAAHLYDLYRVGTVHLRGPRRLEDPANNPPVMSWALMVERKDSWAPNGVAFDLEHLVPVVASTPPQRVVLPLSIRGLFEDFILACERFALDLETESGTGGRVLLERWNSAAAGLTRPGQSKLTW